jgi:hypothetical protein
LRLNEPLQYAGLLLEAVVQKVVQAFSVQELNAILRIS